MKISKLYPFIFIAVSLQSAFAETRPVTLEDITKRVSSENYFVQENAEKVYQAKKTIQLARRNLLPKINLWRLIGGFANPLGLVEDVAPFLVPNNWLRVKEEKFLAAASVHGYRALWANEILTARALLIQSSLDEMLLEQLHSNAKDFDSLRSLIELRETLGSVPPGSVSQFDVRRLTLNEEINALSLIIKSNRSELAYILGYPGNDEAVPAGVKFLAFNELEPLRYEDYETRLLEASYELKQHSSLIQAASQMRKSRYFNFLGVSSMSRGVYGNIFDNLPQQDGLGFGLGPSVQIVRSQRRILESQRKGIEETLRKNLKILVDSYNLDLLTRADAMKRVNSTQEQWKTLADRMDMGAKIDVFTLVEASRNRIEALSSYYSIETRLLLESDRLKRLTYTDAFQVVEGALP